MALPASVVGEPALGLRSVPGMLLMGFLFTASINTLSPLLNEVGFLTGRIGILSLGAYVVLLVSAVASIELTRECEIPVWRRYVVVYLAMLLAMGMIGTVTGTKLRLRILDLLPYGVVLAGFVLGRRDAVWEMLRLPVITITVVGVVVAIRFTDSMVLVDRSILNEEQGSHAESLLVLGTLFFAVSNARYRTWQYLCAGAAALGVLFVCLYFGRRSTSVRTLVEIVVSSIFLPLFYFRRRALGLSSLGGLCAVVAGLLVYFPFETLVQRFSKTYGVIDTLTVGNERWYELSLMAEELSLREKFTGRGLGGTFLTKDFVSEFVTDDEDGGRLTTHVGFGTPLLKGGVVWFSVYYFPLMFVVWNLRRFRTLDPVSVCVAGAAGVLLAAQGIEGTPIYSTALTAFGIGLAGGRAQVISWRHRCQLMGNVADAKEVSPGALGVTEADEAQAVRA